MSSSVVKLGTWGGDGGSAYDLTVAPQRLESITLRWGKVIDWISFSYRDRTGKLHTTGRWGGNGKGEGTETMTLEPSEYVTGVAWSVGPFTFKNVESCITQIKFVTNLRSFGPWGHGVDSTQHTLPVLDGGSVVGMFARAGDFLDALGFYILPAAPLPAAIKPPADSAEQKENHKGDAKEEKSGGQEGKEKDASSQEEEEKEKSGGQEGKEKDASSQEEEEKEKSAGQEEEAKEKDSSHEEKENGKS